MNASVSCPSWATRCCSLAASPLAPPMPRAWARISAVDSAAAGRTATSSRPAAATTATVWRIGLGELLEMLGHLFLPARAEGEDEHIADQGLVVGQLHQVAAAILGEVAVDARHLAVELRFGRRLEGLVAVERLPQLAVEGEVEVVGDVDGAERAAVLAE